MLLDSSYFDTFDGWERLNLSNKLNELLLANVCRLYQERKLLLKHYVTLYIEKNSEF